MTITIKGRPISKKNSRRNFRHVSLPSEAYLAFEEAALYQLKGYRGITFTGPLAASYTFFMKGRLDSDCDNMIASINDILQKAEIIDNDKDIVTGRFRKIAGCADWATEVEIDHMPADLNSFFIE